MVEEVTEEHTHKGLGADHPDSDEDFFIALKQLLGVKAEMPGEVQDELRQTIDEFVETIEEHWPGMPQPLDFDKAPCTAGCKFEDDIIRHMARHVAFGAFALAKTQVEATMAGYERQLQEALKRAVVIKNVDLETEEDDEPEKPKKPLVN